MKELTLEIKSLKTNKAIGIDGIHNEMLKNLGPRAKHWLLSLFNRCLSSLRPKEMETG